MHNDYFPTRWIDSGLVSRIESRAKQAFYERGEQVLQHDGFLDLNVPLNGGGQIGLAFLVSNHSENCKSRTGRASDQKYVGSMDQSAAVYMSCINISGTKVVRSFVMQLVVQLNCGFQGKSVRSIIGATEKRRESVAGGVLAVSAEFSGIGVCLIDGRRRGDGRDSVAVPGVGSVGAMPGSLSARRGFSLLHMTWPALAGKSGILCGWVGSPALHRYALRHKQVGG